MDVNECLDKFKINHNFLGMIFMGSIPDFGFALIGHFELIVGIIGLYTYNSGYN